MHIEPGFISQAKVMGANAAAVGVLGFYAKRLIQRPFDIVKASLAAVFFSIFMQSFHMSVGPSELHFVGAMAIYLTLGFIPTLFGFAMGLLLQGIIFEPTDLPHLAVNSLSLIVPLITVHLTTGKKLFDRSLDKRLSWPAILKLDGIYYAGVTLMVGFWLLIGEVQNRCNPQDPPARLGDLSGAQAPDIARAAVSPAAGVQIRCSDHRSVQTEIAHT